MKKYIPLIGIIVLVIAVVLITSPKDNPGQEKQVTVGFISAMTGDAASWGEGALRGAQIAADEFQAQGKLRGAKVVLVTADDKCDAKEGVTALQQLLLRNPNVIVGTVCSSPTIAMLPITDAQKKIFVSAGATSPKLSELGDYFFRVYPSDSYPASLVGTFAIEKKGLKTFATLTINNEYGDGLRRSFTGAVEKAGGSIVASELFPLNAGDFRTQLTKIKQTNPEGLFIGSNPKEFPLIVRQIKELGIQSVLLGDITYVESDEGKTAWKDVGQLYYSASKESDTAIWKQLQKIYQERFRKEADFIVQIGYDSTRVSLDAMDKVGTDSDKMKEYLYSLKNYEASGGIFTFDQNGDVQKPFQIKEIKNGEAKIVRE